MIKLVVHVDTLFRNIHFLTHSDYSVGRVAADVVAAGVANNKSHCYYSK